MFFGPRKSIARRDSMKSWELQPFNDPFEARYLDKPIQKEMSLFSKKNFSYVDNRKITIITNSTIIIKL